MTLRLTEEQKGQIQDEFEKNPDLKHITQKVFGDDSLDGRSKEGRAVRAFLAKWCFAGTKVICGYIG